MMSYRNYSTVSINGLGPRGLEPREELVRALFAIHLRPPFYPGPHALGPRPLKKDFPPLAAKQKNKVRR
jgi:hypothetical protein